MTCDRCKHITEISELFRECQNCASHGDRCATCEIYLAKKDEAKRIQHFCDNCVTGKLHHEISFDGAPGGMETVIAQAGGIAADALERRTNYLTTGVTKLDPGTENKLRVVLASIMELKPLELLLVQHVFHHRPMATFRETLREIRERLNNRYDLRDKDDKGDPVTSFKAIVSLWGQQIVEKVPALADVFAANKAETAGVK